MLTLCVALLVGALGSVAPAALAFPALVFGIGLYRNRRLAILVMVIAVLFLQAMRASRAMSDRKARRDAFVTAHNGITRCEGHAQIRGSPSLRGERFIAEAYLTVSHCERGPPFADFVTLNFETPLARGDIIGVTVDVGARTEFANGLLLERGMPAARRRVVASASVVATDGEPATHAWRMGAIVDRARNAIRARLNSRFSREAAPLARALILGESDLAPDVDTAFKQSGLAHLLAVSGMHLIVVCGAFACLLRAVLLRVPRIVRAVPPARIVTVAVVPIAFAYTDFTGSSGSAIRAAAMVAMIALANALGRKANVTRALVLAAGGSALVDPMVLFDISFALSMAATASLLALAHVQRERGTPPFANAKSSMHGAQQNAKRVMMASATASLACAPILALLGAECSLLGPLLNVLAIPVGEAYALPLCMLAAVTPSIPFVTDAIITASEGGLRLLAWIAAIGAKPLRVELPWLHDFELGVLGAAAFLFTTHRATLRADVRIRTRRWLYVATLALAVDELGARASRRVARDLRVTFLDVAQGDASLVELPGGKTMLIDAGGLVGSPVDVGKSVVRPALRSRRISRVDIVVLSHPHPDHFGGLKEGLREITVGEIWDSGLTLASATEPAPWLSEKAPIRTSPDLCAARQILAPCPTFDADRRTNDNSLVLRIAHGNISFLFVGDAEREEENAILASALPREALRADVLKVGHHGSATSSSPAWIAAVSPALAIISSGARNRFRHPRPETLATLESAGAIIQRTDRAGSVTVTTDGTDVRVSTAR